jgi:Rieske Fe-S protein
MNRRDFLKNSSLTGIGLAAGIAALQGIDLSNVQAAPLIPGGGIREIPIAIQDTPELAEVGGVFKLDIDDLEKSIQVVRTGESSFLAIDVKCSHKGCDLAYDNKSGEKFVCPCHGSAFKVTGEVINGPASIPVMAYKTSFKDNTVTLYVPEPAPGGDTLSPGGAPAATKPDSSKK